jgi:cell division septal protein FtsQ
MRWSSKAGWGRRAKDEVRQAGARNRSGISSRGSATARQSVRGGKKNRRVASLEPRTSRLEKRRRSRAAIVVSIGVVLGLGGLAGGAVLLHSKLLGSDWLAIERIEVHGLVRADRAQILAVAGVRPGQNLLALDPSEVASAVERHPWVKRARVERRFPHQLGIEVVEHDPRLVVALGNLYYADSEGEIVKRQSPGEHEALPLVTGLSREEVQRGDGRAQARLRDALAFLADLHAVTGAESADVDEIHLDAVQGLSFVRSGDKIQIHVGRSPYKERLEKLEEVRRALSDRGVRALEITLGGERRPERVVARLAPAGQAGR